MRQIRNSKDKAEVTCESEADLTPGNSGVLMTDLDTFTIVWRLENAY